jgi:hypothetical protein
MSPLNDQSTPAANDRLRPAPVRHINPVPVCLSIDGFTELFSCRINSLPQNVALLGWLEHTGRWYCAPLRLADAGAGHFSRIFQQRGTDRLIDFLSRDILPALNTSSLWFPFAFYDGWRERVAYSNDFRWITPPDLGDWPEWQGAPGELPILSPSRHWLACYGAHQGDPSALLLPEAHYLMTGGYAHLFAEVQRLRTPWQHKRTRAIFAGGDHGDYRNFFVAPADISLHPRRLLQQVVVQQSLDVDVHLGQSVSRAEQMSRRYILDVDGFARTWDAWAWKMMSGSAVLSVASPWVSFFTEQFSAWEHFVPVSNDLSDLAEKIAWCHDHDAECEAIAGRALERATTVYRRDAVAERLLQKLRSRLAEAPPEDWA